MPTYLALIDEAIVAEHNNATSLPRLKKFVAARKGPLFRPRLLLRALKDAVASGHLDQIRASYKLAARSGTRAPFAATPLSAHRMPRTKRAVVAALGAVLAPLFPDVRGVRRAAIASASAAGSHEPFAQGLRGPALDDDQRTSLNFWLTACIEQLTTMHANQRTQADATLVYDVKQVVQKIPFQTGYEMSLEKVATTVSNVPRMGAALQRLLT